LGNLRNKYKDHEEPKKAGKRNTTKEMKRPVPSFLLVSWLP